MADKFKNARQRLKNMNLLSRTATRDKLARVSKQGGLRAEKQSSTSGTATRKDPAAGSIPSDNNPTSVDRYLRNSRELGVYQRMETE